MEDNEIIDLFWQRDETAISTVAVKYSRYCHSISYNILRSKEDADECVNDTYLRAWNAIPPTRPNKLSVFLGTITRRLSLSRYSKIRAEKRGFGEVEIALAELEEILADTSSGYDSQMDSEIIVAALNSFLASLPSMQRNVFVRRYWHLRSIAEVAGDYGLSIQNVKQILFRLRKKLKINLEKEGIVL
jgi:RNA polymerase sigma-70 factor (ECF subfamily)